MKNALIWTGRAALALGVVAAVGVVAVYVLSGRILAERFDVPETELTIAVPTGDPQAVERGERLASITGCTACHGPTLAGQVFIDVENVLRLVAPNLMQVAANASDADLVRAIRYGVKRNGTGVLGMPSMALHHLTDDDLAAIIAYLRAQPMAPPPEIDTSHHFLVRLGLVIGQFDLPAVEVRDRIRRMASPDRNDPMQLGAYVAQIACAECHGERLDGNPRYPSPPLATVRTYERAEFAALLTAGRAADGASHALKTRTARERFGRLAEPEIDALYRYLRTLSPSRTD